MLEAQAPIDPFPERRGLEDGRFVPERSRFTQDLVRHAGGNPAPPMAFRYAHQVQSRHAGVQGQQRRAYGLAVEASQVRRIRGDGRRCSANKAFEFDLTA